MSLSNFKMKAIKESLTRTLNDNIDKKAIVYSNVAKSVTTICDSLDNIKLKVTLSLLMETLNLSGSFFLTKIYRNINKKSLHDKQ